MTTTDANGGTAHKGKVQPDKGKVQPDKGKVQPDKGRVSSNGQAILGAVTGGAACVVLRASVETFGPAGDAELNFNVKWPGTALGAVSSMADPCDNEQDCDAEGIDASGNLYLPATYPLPHKQS
jgi:hypothetical protein